MLIVRAAVRGRLSMTHAERRPRPCNLLARAIVLATGHAPRPTLIVGPPAWRSPYTCNVRAAVRGGPSTSHAERRPGPGDLHTPTSFGLPSAAARPRLTRNAAPGQAISIHPHRSVCRPRRPVHVSRGTPPRARRSPYTHIVRSAVRVGPSTSHAERRPGPGDLHTPTSFGLPS